MVEQDSEYISGGEGIRTPVTLSGQPVFKTGEEDSLTGDQVKGCENAADRLGVLLGAVRRVDPDLASVIAAWQKLAPAIRAGILAIIAASENG